jgi:hypothetical protein
VLGVADSSSLLVADDLHSNGFDDALLADLCAAKSAGSPLSSLLSRGIPILFRYSFFFFFRILHSLLCHEFAFVHVTCKVMDGWIVQFSGQCQLFNNPEARRKVIDTASVLGKTTGL